MLNKLTAFSRRYEMVRPGDRVICAVSGGADSMALLWAMYLLKEKLGITLEAAHFNHGLRGAESDRDARFVQDFCAGYGITLHLEAGAVHPGKKGLEAAAREARYTFLESLPGKIATAHTADDNAETLLMHLVRGTGLKGLGGITPVRGRIIRPMLTVNRTEVLAFLEEYSIPYVSDSSNDTDDFLRNRLRHRVMPLLREENPRFAENLTQMALQLRQDEAVLESLDTQELPAVSQLRTMPAARRSRALAAFLKRCGVKEPEREHIALAESLVFSQKPSARASFPGGITVCRDYDRLRLQDLADTWQPVRLPVFGQVQIGSYRITCRPATEFCRTPSRFTVLPQGEIRVRPRQAGDSIHLTGGNRSLKKLFIDRKIPADRRDQIPVLCDAGGILAVCGIGADLLRCSDASNAVEILIKP